MAPTGQRGEWAIDAETRVYLGDRVEVAIAQIRSPAGRECSHEVVRSRSEDVAAVVVDADDRVLLLWRHRFESGSWGLELPTGTLRQGEEPVEAAAREVVATAGWSTSSGGRRVWSGARAPAIGDLVAHLVWLRAGDRVGMPGQEAAAHLHWLDRVQVRNALAEGQVRELLTLAALLWWLTPDGVTAPLTTARPDDPRLHRS